MRGEARIDVPGSTSEDEQMKVLEKLKGNTDSEKVLPELIKALGDSSWRVRKEAGELLLHFPSKRDVVFQLIESIQVKENPGLRNAALDVLVKMGSQVTGLITEVLENPDESIRKFAVDILGQIAAPTSEKLLIDLLKDSDKNVRMAAAEWLGKYDTPKSHEVLLKLLSDGDLSMKFYALQSLGGHSREVPLDVLKPLIDNQLLRRGVFEAMGSSSEEGAVDLLVEGLQDKASGSVLAALRGLARIYSEKPKLKEEIKRRLEKAPKDKLGSALDMGLKSVNILNAQAALQVAAMSKADIGAKMIVKAISDTRLEAQASRLLAEMYETSPTFVTAALPPDGDPLRKRLLVTLAVEKPSVEAESDDKSLKNKVDIESLEKPDVFARTERPGSIEPMTASEFEELREKIYDYCGIHFKDEMKFLVERRTLHRVRALELRSFGSYIGFINSGHKGERELNELIANLTTNETYFFREGFQLKAFSDEILPSMVESKRMLGDNEIKILSAGCSTGEEPYTLAMLLMEKEDAFKGMSIKIFGTDISEKVLATAKEGIYSKASFRVTDTRYKAQYFEPLDEGKFRVKDIVRSKINFEVMNLMEEDRLRKLAPMDIIFCRNVIIYFDEMAKKKLVETFFNTLSDGGYLLLGHSESLLNISTKFKLVHLQNDIVYQKPYSDIKGKR